MKNKISSYLFAFKNKFYYRIHPATNDVIAQKSLNQNHHEQSENEEHLNRCDCISTLANNNANRQIKTTENESGHRENEFLEMPLESLKSNFDEIIELANRKAMEKECFCTQRYNGKYQCLFVRVFPVNRIYIFTRKKIIKFR